MTLALFQLQKRLPTLKNAPLPPARLTTEMTQMVGLPQKLSSRARVDLTMISHFGYGVVCALLYSTIAPRSSAKPWMTGSFFGALVWATSYLGWIPAFGFKTSAYKLTGERNLQMFLAHLVWGASLGIAESELRNRGKRMLDAGCAL
jgi:uncharacterized membrane protein YagU involved in acid resistance